MTSKEGNVFLIIFFSFRGSEKILVLAQERIGHTCDYQFTVKAINVWAAMEIKDADNFYNIFKSLGPNGIPLNRECRTNSTGSCGCQVILAPFSL